MPDTVTDRSADEISATQREDIATLFAERMTAGTLQSVAENVLGAADAALLPGGKKEEFALTVVEALHKAGKLGAALSIVTADFCRDVRLIRALNHVSSRRRLSDFNALQKIVKSADDPFLDDRFVEEVYPGLRRKMCAIGLGDADNINDIMGSGFLVGADEVMTNFHVVEDYLEEDGVVDGEMTYRERVTGDNIFCFFDYTAAPKPDVPPTGRYAGTVVQAVSGKWLVRARGSLPGDGKPPRPDRNAVGRKFDYAIIKLAQPVGEQLSRRSGGVVRGWVELRAGVEEHGKKPLIVVMQHPGGLPLLWDVGEFDRIDVSGTRVWYAVNTANGSSGGAAINKKGQLYALHNAQVWQDEAKTTKLLAGNNREVNQGVRIEAILDDLAEPPRPWRPKPPPAAGNFGYWSLTDTIDDAQPIIGRRLFRDTIQRMMKPDSTERLLSVLGHPGSGRNFSVRLLRRIIGGDVPIIEFSPTDLGTLTPDRFLAAIKEQLDLPDDPPIPTLAESSASPVKWSNSELTKWLKEAVTVAQRERPACYPCWIVLNAVGRKANPVDPDPELKWATGLQELLTALFGGQDIGQNVHDVPQLRWLMLGAPNTPFPSTRNPQSLVVDNVGQVRPEVLSSDFADCLMLAWLALSRKGSNSHVTLSSIAKNLIAVVPPGITLSVLSRTVIDALKAGAEESV
jgi:hypothetical protein